jgi:hypothetical protein
VLHLDASSSTSYSSSNPAIWSDLSPNANHMTLNSGVTFVDSQTEGKYFAFDRTTNGYMRRATVSGWTSKSTFSAVVFFRANGNNNVGTLFTLNRSPSNIEDEAVWYMFGQGNFWDYSSGAGGEPYIT